MKDIDSNKAYYTKKDFLKKTLKRDMSDSSEGSISEEFLAEY